MRGTVKWYNDVKKYGFLKGEDGKDYFVHVTNIDAPGYKTLQKSARVEFDAANNERGPIAMQVKTLW